MARALLVPRELFLNFMLPRQHPFLHKVICSIIVSIAIIYLFFKFSECFFYLSLLPIKVRGANLVALLRHQIVYQKVKSKLIGSLACEGQTGMYTVVDLGIDYLLVEMPDARQLIFEIARLGESDLMVYIGGPGPVAGVCAGGGFDGTSHFTVFAFGPHGRGVHVHVHGRVRRIVGSVVLQNF